MPETEQNPLSGPGFRGLLLMPATWMRAGIVFAGMFTLLLLHLPFYGDQATLVSAPAQFYHTTGFRALLPPAELATGHPPLYPMLIALLWTVFGKSLAVVHVWTGICLVFLLVQVNRLASLWLSDQARAIALMLVLCYPVLWAQTAAMSADVLMSGLVLYGLRSVVEGRKYALSGALAILLLLSLRGWIWGLFLALFILIHHRRSARALLHHAVALSVACLPVALYFFLQYRASGWFLMPAHGQWAAHRNLVDGLLLGGKAFELVLRCVEFGMLIPVLLAASRIRRSLHSDSGRAMTTAWLAALMAVAVFTLPFRGPIVIRYLLPLQLLVLISAGAYWMDTAPKLRRVIGIAITLVLMLSAHFFAYPHMQRSLFAYSWGDGSLAHLGYFRYRAEGAAFLEAEGIARDRVFTSFPEYKSFALTDLTEDTVGYRPIDTASVSRLPYVIYANTMNMVRADVLDTLQRTHTVIFERKGYPVQYVIYKRKE